MSAGSILHDPPASIDDCGNCSHSAAVHYVRCAIVDCGCKAPDFQHPRYLQPTAANEPSDAWKIGRLQGLAYALAKELSDLNEAGRIPVRLWIYTADSVIEGLHCPSWNDRDWARVYADARGLACIRCREPIESPGSLCDVCAADAKAHDEDPAQALYRAVNKGGA